MSTWDRWKTRETGGREDEDPLSATDYGYLMLDGTEDDDDDEDDEVAQNILLILVAKYAKTGTNAATCLRVGEHATNGVAESAMRGRHER